MKPILVTGGAGFIGAHTCKALAASGLHPRIIRELRPGADVAVVSNPEFLREGAAIHDFKHPDRLPRIGRSARWPKWQARGAWGRR